MYTRKPVAFSIVDDDIRELAIDKGMVMREPFLRQTEQVIQKMSVRYTHEVLNALTPALGVMQILKNNLNKKLTDKDLELIQLAQDELIKGKDFINDFMMINFSIEPERQCMTVLELKEYIEARITKQIPECIPYLTFQLAGSGDERVFIDAKQLRLAIYFIVNNWLDYATCPSVITIQFTCHANDELHVKMSMSKEKVPIAQTDDEFKLLLHLIKQHVKRNDGEMWVGDNITLVYPAEK